MKRIIILIVSMTMAAWPSLSRADRDTGRLPAYRVDAGMEIRGFNWAEHLDDGFELLTETGWLAGMSYDLESTATRFGWPILGLPVAAVNRKTATRRVDSA